MKMDIGVILLKLNNVSLSSNYISAATQAAANWFHTGYHTNPLYPMTQTYTQNQSPIDLYNDTSLPYGVVGRTNYFMPGGTQISVDTSGPVSDWRYCKILINETLFEYVYGEDDDYYSKMKALMLHEMGHVFGLAHTTDTNTIMYPYLDGMNATSVTYSDSAALVQKLHF